MTVTPTMVATLGTAYWYGGQVSGAPAAMALSNGTLSNWSTGQTYAATGLVPGPTDNVIFSAAGATQQGNVVLGANMTVNSLTFNDTNTVTIGSDGNTLTLMGTGSGVNSAISANQNATINANLALGAAQTWTVASGKTLTIGGAVSGAFGLTTAGGGTLAVANGGTTSSLTNTAITNDATLVFNPSSAGISVSSSISGPGSLYQVGSGATTLSGALSYTGSTIVSQGMLVLAGNSLSSPDLSIVSGGTLQINSPSSAGGGVGVETSITGGGVYQKTGPGLWDMVGVGTNKSVSLSQGALIDVEGGELRLGWDLSAWCSWANNMAGLNVASGAIFDLWDSNTINVDALTGAGTVQAGEGSMMPTLVVGVAGGSGTFSGTIKNNGGTACLIKAGTGVQTLSGINTYSGPTAVNGGTLQIGNGGSGENLASPTVAVSNNATLAFSHSDTLTYSGAISGSGQVTEQGGGMLILSGSNTYSGPTTVTGGTLEIGNGGTGEYLTSPSITMSSNATVEFNHADTYPGGYSGTISGSGQFVKAGSGSLTLNGANSYTGATTISAGTLVLGGSDLPMTTALTVATGGALDMGGNSQAIGSLSGAAGAIIMNNLVHPSHTYTSSLTVSPTSGTTTFAGNIVELDTVEFPRQRGVDDVRQRRIGPHRGEHVFRRDDDRRRRAGDRRRQRLARQRVGVDQRRRAVGFGERRGHSRIARGLVAGRFGRCCLERRGVGPGDDRRLRERNGKHGDARRRLPHCRKAVGEAPSAELPRPCRSRVRSPCLLLPSGCSVGRGDGARRHSRFGGRVRRNG